MAGLHHLSHLYLHGIAHIRADDRPFPTTPTDRALKPALPFNLLKHLVTCLDRPLR
ncbi:MAG: hypothetical protein KME42_10335 [Tildeniella nuda ZEHNDER 1965/U140]|nr:hypothetical protein [Tildeniella nuda ZEHNDER 1965/U140]